MNDNRASREQRDIATTPRQPHHKINHKKEKKGKKTRKQERKERNDEVRK
jgi:hypothetical protein